MITLSNLKPALLKIGFTVDPSNPQIYVKNYQAFGCSVSVDFANGKINYPTDKGFIVNDSTTCNLTKNENFVVLECVVRLLDKGYRPEHIELERKWQLGLDEKGGKADICVKNLDGKSMLFIVECKTAGQKYKEAYDILVNTDQGGQLFSYWKQDTSTQWIVLYCSDYDGSNVTYKNVTIRCTDDANILKYSKKDQTILTYEKASTVEQYHQTWKETYNGDFYGDVIFDDESQAYNVGLKLLKKKALKDFSVDDKIVNRFEEILRHNNVSDKENAFNRLIALFICKLADEISKNQDDVVDFQYKVGTDTYESLQDRLQKLHQQGMDEFMKEKIFYISDDYAEKVITQYTGQNRKKLIEELNNTLRILKFYTNNDFSFKDVHNEELFYQNGKVLVEVVQLFQPFRIINSNSLQLLGDLFEQLLNKGFKQNEGQFFTPIPITRFIWKSIPYESIIHSDEAISYPKIIDYACGAGHFLTEGVEEINDHLGIAGAERTNSEWVFDKIYGIEKDYRLARVSKISLFMHGAGNGNIIFGDGLENYADKNIIPNSFDILVANPPYSVSAFKPHLKLKNNDFEILKYISNDGSEIETLFVERISQLVKPGGYAAVILPSSILNKENNSYIEARASVLKNFEINAIIQFGGKTFGATGTNTVVLFLRKYNEPPKRVDMVEDSISSIFSAQNLEDWEDNDILNGYLDTINVSKEEYLSFLSKTVNYDHWKEHPYFAKPYNAFISSSDYSAKIKQKTFKILPEDEQNKYLTQRFTDFALTIEREKIFYYGLVYQQNPVIITSPTDNALQEKFLGYKWSNRKGQEGIQITKEGGLLFDSDPDFESISRLIHDNFSGTKHSFESLSSYYFYTKLEDLLDFRSVNFTKVIKLVPKRKLKNDPSLLTVELSSPKFDITIGNRVLSSEIVEDGAIPVYSANVHMEFGRINKKNLTDFSKDSVIWGIDGDWMVNVIPAGKEFYPTDHCGVLRLNTDEIDSDYMMYALLKEGRYQRFSRQNRASTERIKNLIIQFPKIDKQKTIAAEIHQFDESEEVLYSKIADLEKKTKKLFNDLFGSMARDKRLGDYFDVLKGTAITQAETTPGDVPVVAGGLNPSCYHNVSNRPAGIVTISASGANAGYVNYWDVPIFASDCNTVNTKNDSIALNIFAYFFLHYIQEDIYALQPPEAGQPHVYGTDIENIMIMIPDITIQQQFASKASKTLKEIQKLFADIKKLDDEKESALSKYFD